MVLNENKTKGILIGTSQRLSRCQSDLEIIINNHKIECSEYEKLLGIQIDKCLSFVKHIDYVCKNLTSKISLLCKIKQYLPLETRKTILQCLYSTRDGLLSDSMGICVQVSIRQNTEASKTCRKDNFRYAS